MGTKGAAKSHFSKINPYHKPAEMKAIKPFFLTGQKYASKIAKERHYWHAGC